MGSNRSGRGRSHCRSAPGRGNTGRERGGRMFPSGLTGKPMKPPSLDRARRAVGYFPGIDAQSAAWLWARHPFDGQVFGGCRACFSAAEPLFTSRPPSCHPARCPKRVCSNPFPAPLEPPCLRNGFTTVPLASRLIWAGGGTVENPAPTLPPPCLGVSFPPVTSVPRCSGPLRTAASPRCCGNAG